MPFEFDQSKSTTAHPAVLCGSVKPEPLHGMMIVLWFICHVGGRFGTCASTSQRKESVRANSQRLVERGIAGVGIVKRSTSVG